MLIRVLDPALSHRRIEAVVFPVSDDNSDRKGFPYATVFLILTNLFVFVVLQGMGKNEDFTLAYVQVPAEIISGRDQVTDAHTRTIAVQGQQVEVFIPGLKPTPIPVWFTPRASFRSEEYR